jgi:putative phosphoribosyl transferase
MAKNTRVHEISSLRDRAPVFRDRAHAGEALAGMLAAYRGSDALVLAIPAGGVPVAAEVARRLDLALDVAVVSKILLPWTTEAGFGAVAFDGSIWINEADVLAYHLSRADVQRSTASARDKVERRLRRLRGKRPLPAFSARTLILVDDGIAAGSTLRAGIAALRRHGAREIAVAVPTGHLRSVELIDELVDAVYCANIRGGNRYAVADAYEQWRDVDEGEVAAILAALEEKNTRA